AEHGCGPRRLYLTAPATSLATSVPPAAEGASPTRSAAMLLHGHMKVEDVPVRITHIEGAMPPRLGRQLLDPIHRQALQPGVRPVNILDLKLRQIYARADLGADERRRCPRGHIDGSRRHRWSSCEPCRGGA